jgi:hypothetical protein
LQGFVRVNSSFSLLYFSHYTYYIGVVKHKT